MGAGILQLLVEKGITAIGVSRSAERFDALREQLERATRLSVRRKRADADEVAQGLGVLRLTTETGDLGEAAIVIEAIIEEAPAKAELLGRLAAAAPTATLCTNTSSLSVRELASAAGTWGRLVGLHFMNPPAASKLVELIGYDGAGPDHRQRAADLGEALGLKVIEVQDRPGFAVNRLLMPVIAEAARALAEGVASARDLDDALRLGCGHPMGPLALADFIGLDIVLHELERMTATLGERYEPPANLVELVAAGNLGRKSGAGFFPYRRGG